MFKITTNLGLDFENRANKILLNEALDSGIKIPYSCSNGRCGSCKCKVISGKSVLEGSELSLSKMEANEGWILSCLRKPISNMEIYFNDIISENLPKIKTFPTRINSLKKLTEDILEVKLRLPPKSDFSFLSGQHISISSQSGITRSYSLANPVSEINEIELHIKKVENGKMSKYWFEDAKKDDLLRFKGPLGTFFLREVKSKNLIFLATGTGISPIMSMYKTINKNIQNESPKSISIFWGNRFKEDFYYGKEDFKNADLFFQTLSKKDSNWKGEIGYVQNVLKEKIKDFNHVEIYACGSINMIKDTKKTLEKKDCVSNKFYSDAFVSTQF